VPVETHGSRADQGSETYIEIKAPAAMGKRSSTPYVKVLPKYKKRAEKAIGREQIPKAQQKRVRDYFRSLEGGQ